MPMASRRGHRHRQEGVRADIGTIIAIRPATVAKRRFTRRGSHRVHKKHKGEKERGRGKALPSMEPSMHPIDSFSLPLCGLCGLRVESPIFIGSGLASPLLPAAWKASPSPRLIFSRPPRYLYAYEESERNRPRPRHHRHGQRPHKKSGRHHAQRPGDPGPPGVRELGLHPEARVQRPRPRPHAEGRDQRPPHGRPPRRRGG